MPVYVSFLRGVNMTGHNSMKMAELSALYNDLGFSDVTTIIQSGNVIFGAGEEFKVLEISVCIEKAIRERFSFDIPVMIRTPDELKILYSANPFLSENNFDPSKNAVIFLYEKATGDQIAKIINIDYPPDKFKVEGKEIFIYCPNGFGKTKLYTNFFEKKMRVTGTARNWNTVLTIMDIAHNLELK
jgi:uncharacterized protein (DUF1697 family)